MSEHRRIPVLFISGWSYGGSTILGNVLGEVDGFFAGGELRRLWTLGVLENQPCGCGARFGDCALWAAVVRAAPETLEVETARRMVELDRALLLHRRYPQLRFADRIGGRRKPLLEEYRARLAALYAAVHAASACRVIIDQSKSPLYGLVLEGIPSIDLRIVHLVRDSRGWAHSRQKRRASGRPVEGLTFGALLWNASHLVAELAWARRPHHLRVRYEDFARQPEATVRAILDFAGEPGDGRPFVAPGRVVLRPNHNVGGNQNRFRSGAIEIRLDDDWRRQLAARDRALVTSLTWPLLVRHGYLGHGATAASASSVRPTIRSTG